MEYNHFSSQWSFQEASEDPYFRDFVAPQTDDRQTVIKLGQCTQSEWAPGTSSNSIEHRLSIMATNEGEFSFPSKYLMGVQC